MRFFRKDDHELVMQIQRFAAGSAFLWFGIDKWVRPEAWYDLVPGWVWPFATDFDLSLYLYGTVEVAIGACMITGRYVREAAIAGFVFLAGTTLSAGASEITVRDLAVMGLFLSLAVHADAAAKHRLPPRLIRGTVGLYAAYLFIYGVLYLRAAPIAG